MSDAANSSSEHNLLPKSQHLWEGNRKEISEGLNACTHMHMYTHGILRFQYLNTSNVDLTLNEVVWLPEITLWYHGRRGGANRISLHLIHMTPPLLFCLTSKGFDRWMMITDLWRTAERAQRERTIEPAVSLLLSHDKSTIVRPGSTTQRAVSMDTPALSSIYKTHWYSDYLRVKKIHWAIRSASLQQTAALNKTGWEEKQIITKVLKGKCWRIFFGVLRCSLDALPTCYNDTKPSVRFLSIWYHIFWVFSNRHLHALAIQTEVRSS